MAERSDRRDKACRLPGVSIAARLRSFASPPQGTSLATSIGGRSMMQAQSAINVNERRAAGMTGKCQSLRKVGHSVPQSAVP